MHSYSFILKNILKNYIKSARTGDGMTDMRVAYCRQHSEVFPIQDLQLIFIRKYLT